MLVGEVEGIALGCKLGASVYRSHAVGSSTVVSSWSISDWVVVRSLRQRAISASQPQLWPATGPTQSTEQWCTRHGSVVGELDGEIDGEIDGESVGRTVGATVGV